MKDELSQQISELQSLHEKLTVDHDEVVAQNGLLKSQSEQSRTEMVDQIQKLTRQIREADDIIDKS